MSSTPHVSKAAVTIALAAAGLLTGCTNPKDTPKTGPNRTGVAPSGITQNHYTFTTGPATSTSIAAVDPTIATIGTTTITQADLQKPLIEAYGFNMLMLVVQREMARDACKQGNITVTPDDVKWEYQWTLEQMFPNVRPDDDREKLLDQYLAQPKPRDQTATRAELDVIIETNAYLRKLVEPNARKAVGDELLQQLFDETYGAQIQVRDIVTDNPQDAMAVRRRIDAGEDFATLAKQFSRDPRTRPLGGEFPPFTMKSQTVPENFKQVANSLKPGEVSDPVQAGGGYHIIKLERKVAPKAVKFADVKDDLRREYEGRVVQEGVKAVRGRLAQQALVQLNITDPALKAEFDKRLAARDALIRDREKMREQMEKDREANRAGPATVPAVTPPTSTPATSTPVVPPATTTTTKPASTQTTPAVVTPPAATTKPTPPPVATKPATPPAAATQAVPVVPAPPRTQPATTQAAESPIDPTTGLPLAVPGRVRTGVAPIGVVQNSGRSGFTQGTTLNTGKPAAAAGATPTTAPSSATVPSTRPK